MQPKCRTGGTYCGSGEPEASGQKWMLGIPRRNSGNRFLKQACRTKLHSAMRHILRTSAAERLAATLPTEAQSRQLFIGLQQSHSTTERAITAL